MVPLSHNSILICGGGGGGWLNDGFILRSDEDQDIRLERAFVNEDFGFASNSNQVIQTSAGQVAALVQDSGNKLRMVTYKENDRQLTQIENYGDYDY